MANIKSNSIKRDNKRAEAIKIVSKKFNCTDQYVRLIINSPNYYYGNSNEIRMAYKSTYKQLEKILS